MEEKQYVDSGEIRCICEFSEDDGFTIQCDRCLIWQHIECLGIAEDALPDFYRCERCFPREVDVARAIRIQSRKLGLRKPKNAKLLKVKRPGERGRRGSRGPDLKSSTAPSPGSTAGRPGRKKRKHSAPTSPRESGREHSRVRSPKQKKISTSDPLLQLYNTLIQNKSWFRSYPPLVPLSSSKKAKYVLCSSSLPADNPRDIILIARIDAEASRNGIVFSPDSSSSKKPRSNEGVFAQKPVPSGQLLFEVTGQPILQSNYFKNPDNLFQLMGTLTSSTKFHPSINLGIVSSEASSFGNRIRSHCQPNSELRSFYIEGSEPFIRLGVFATSAISPNEEIRLPWTLCGDLLPNGLIDRYDDEVSFKQATYYAFNEIFKDLKNAISSGKARRMINILRSESCSCSQEPSCLLNSFFKVRRFFYSKVQLSDLILSTEKHHPPKTASANSSLTYPIQVPAPTPNSISEAPAELNDDSSSSSSQDQSQSASGGSKHQSDFDNETADNNALGQTLQPSTRKRSHSAVLSNSSPDSLSHRKSTRILPVTPSKLKKVSLLQPYSPRSQPRPSSRDSPAAVVSEVDANLVAPEASQRIEKLRGMSLLKYFLTRWKSENGLIDSPPQAEGVKHQLVLAQLTPPSIKDLDIEPEAVQKSPLSTNSPPFLPEPVKPTSPLIPSPELETPEVKPEQTLVSPTIRHQTAEQATSVETTRRPSVGSVKSKTSNPTTPVKNSDLVVLPEIRPEIKVVSIVKEVVAEPELKEAPKEDIKPLPKINSTSIPESNSFMGPGSRNMQPPLYTSRFNGKHQGAYSSATSTPVSLTRPGSPNSHQKFRDMDFSRSKRPKPSEGPYNRPRMANSNLAIPNRENESEAEEGEISHFSESPIPDSLRNNEFLASHPHPPPKNDRGKFMPYPPNDRDRHSGYSYDRHPREYSRGSRDLPPRDGPRDSQRDHVGLDRGHRGPIRNRGNPRYPPPSPPINYRVDDRYQPRRDRVWNGEASIDYHSPGSHSTLHHDPPTYRSHTPLSIPNFYRNGSGSHSYHVNPHSLSNGNSHSLSNGNLHVNTNGGSNLPPSSHRRHAVPAPPPLSTPDGEQ